MRHVTKTWIDNGQEYTVSWYAGEPGIYVNGHGKFASYQRAMVVLQFTGTWQSGRMHLSAKQELP